MRTLKVTQRVVQKFRSDAPHNSMRRYRSGATISDEALRSRHAASSELESQIGEGRIFCSPACATAKHTQDGTMKAISLQGREARQRIIPVSNREHPRRKKS